VPRPEDDLFHPRDDDPYWNESSWIAFRIPERGIGGMIYYYHRPNMAHSAGGPVLWDSSGSEIFDCLYWGWDTLQPLSPGADMNTFTFENSLTVNLVEPLQELRIGYKRQDCELDLTWRAIMAPQEMKRRESGELNPGISDWIDDAGSGSLNVGHWEQPGRMTGTARIGEETFAVDCFSIRDHSWGPRAVRDMPRASFVWGIASEADHFALSAVSDLPREQDPIDGTSEPIVAGWRMQDGVLGHFVSGRRMVTSRGPDGRPLVTVIQAVDDQGREFRIEGRSQACLRWTGYSHLQVWWCVTEWNLGGNRFFGEVTDYWTFQQNRQFMRWRASER
jgi:hypothetical protein